MRNQAVHLHGSSADLCCWSLEYLLRGRQTDSKTPEARSRRSSDPCLGNHRPRYRVSAHSRPAHCLSVCLLSPRGELRGRLSNYQHSVVCSLLEYNLGRLCSFGFDSFMGLCLGQRVKIFFKFELGNKTFSTLEQGE